MQVRFLGQEDLLKKEMAAHSSILTREIPWPEKPGGPQSMGLQRVRHNLASEQQQQWWAGAGGGERAGFGRRPLLGLAVGAGFQEPERLACGIGGAGRSEEGKSRRCILEACHMVGSQSALVEMTASLVWTFACGWWGP